MYYSVLTVLDSLFTALHLGVIAVNLTGWIFARTRKAHLVVLSLTFLSWFGPGFYYGIGYCFLTDWHFLILRELGYMNLPQSFITFALWRFLGLHLSDELVMQVTAWTAAVILVATIWVWRRPIQVIFKK